MKTIATTIATISALAVSLSVFTPIAHAQSPQEIEDLRERYEAATNANDAAAVAALHAQDARVLPPGPDMLDGREAIQQHFSERFEMTSPSDFQISSTETREIGEAHLDYGTYSMNAMIPGGQELTVTGDYMALIEERDGEWLITLQTFNEDAPAPR
ncbi:MAG TPA: SgcJ/EcaC family oxidoreductase [Saliniramus sp.]|nr:SgcJ/EcaC family oxidoreductase [Saliniramus sp.]